MPSAIVEDLIRRVNVMEKSVAVLLSWHKFQVGLLVAILAACLELLVKK